MEKQFEKKTTFFDLNIDKNEKDVFVTPYYIVPNSKKYRSINNKKVVSYLRGVSLSKEDEEFAKKFLSGKYFAQKRQEYGHCKLCSTAFTAKVLEDLSKNYKYWDICFPTSPYTPAGMMIYLKDKEKTHTENIQDLSTEEFEEMFDIMQDLYNKLDGNLPQKEVVGINLLFNQISKSQLCIHAHIELMLKDVDKLGLGCELRYQRPFDLLAESINCCIKDKPGIYKQNEGLRIDVDEIGSAGCLKIIDTYEKNIQNYIGRGKALQKNELIPQNFVDKILKNNLSPAPINYVYATYYRDKKFISCIPEVALDLVDVNDLHTEEDFYTLKINIYGENNNCLFKQNHPKLRPSIAILEDEKQKSNIDKLQNQVEEVLSK